jgi:hypothetical protein
MIIKNIEMPKKVNKLGLKKCRFLIKNQEKVVRNQAIVSGVILKKLQ